MKEEGVLSQTSEFEGSSKCFEGWWFRIWLKPCGGGHCLGEWVCGVVEATEVLPC